MTKKIDDSSISIIIPVYNSSGWIVPTLIHILKAIKKSKKNNIEIIIIDDGSKDESAEEVSEFIKKNNKLKIPIKLIKQENKGRYVARKKGVKNATNKNILFIDSRVFIDENSISYLTKQLSKNKDSDEIWNGHVNVVKEGNIFARFWDAIAFIGWRKYFKKPKKMSYGLKDFDHYPKGTGFFYVNKARLLKAMNYFEKNTNDIEFSSDDTLLIRYLAKDKNINLSPEFSCSYNGRSTFKGFLKHAFNRGQFFVDGFLRPGTRFFYPLLFVLFLTVLIIVGLFINLKLAIILLAIGALFFILGLFFGALILGVSPKDSAALAILGVPFALVYLAGIWRGIGRKINNQPVVKKSINFLMKKRRFLAGSIAEYTIVTLLYGFILLLFTKTLFFNLDTQIFAGIGDGTAGFMWLNYADPGISPFISYTDQVNYPVGESIGGPTFITYTLLWVPMRVLTTLFGVVAGMNLMMIIGFLTSSMAMYLLVKKITGNKLIAFVAGFAVAFSPYAIGKSLAHLSYIYSWVFVFITGAFMYLWLKPTMKKSILFGVAVACAFYTDGYYILISSVLTAGLIFGGLLFGLITKFSASDFIKRIRYLSVSFLTLIILLSPIILTQINQGAEVSAKLSANRSNIEGEMKEYRSKVIDFMLPPLDSLAFKDSQQLSVLHDYKNLRSNSGENNQYISGILWLLSAFGWAIFLVVIFFRNKFSLKLSNIDIKNFILIGSLFFVVTPLLLSFMFSPEIHVLGHTISLPGRILVDYNISLWRVMSRFFVALNVIVVLFSSFSMYLLFLYISQSKLKYKKALKIIISIIIVCILGLSYARDIKGLPFSFKNDSPMIYSWLSHQNSISVIAELPYVDPLDRNTAEYVSFQMIHKKMLVNMREPNANRMSNALGVGGSETIDFFRQRGVDAVITRGDSCAAQSWGVLIKSAKDSKNVYYCVYRLNKKHSDDFFVVFRDGFNPSPNSLDQSFIVMNSPTGKMNITNSRFENVSGEARLTANLSVNYSDNPTWKIIQNNKILQSGNSSGIIDVIIDASKPIELTIDSAQEDFIGSAVLSEVIVTKIN